MAKLMSREEYERFSEKFEGNELGIKLLREIEQRGLVRKTRTPTKKELQDRAWQEHLIETWQVQDHVSIQIFRVENKVWYRYPYPFCNAKKVERSTGISAKPSFPDKVIHVPDIHRFGHLLFQQPEAPDDKRFLTMFRGEAWVATGGSEVLDGVMSGRWPKQYEFFNAVDNPRGLLDKLLSLDGDHYTRLYHDCLSAVVKGDDSAKIRRMRTRLYRYSLVMWLELENKLRVQSGLKPIRSVIQLTRIQQADKRIQRKE